MDERQGMGTVAGGVAPGRPGIAPSWTTSAKTAVGTAASAASRVWFTLSHGIVNEVYFPRVDQANTRDFELLVTDGADYFSEEKRDTVHEVLPVAQTVPAFMVTNRCREDRYEIRKTILAHPERDVLLQRVTFEARAGTRSDYRLYALLAPHLANHGAGNTAWAGDYKGVPMLFAERAGTALALACSTPFVGRSCGYVGVSDGWQELRRHGRLVREYERAEDGNVALTAEIDVAACDGGFTLALGFGASPDEAARKARAALIDDFSEVLDRYIAGWHGFHSRGLSLPAVPKDGIDLNRHSVSVIRTHDAKQPAGAIVASLSVPWGSSKGDEDLGGYHLVWPRDLVQSAMGLLAAGQTAEARETLFYLLSVQEADGHWPQNHWIDGAAYWSGVQMDETALPILLADALRRSGALEPGEVWAAIRSAAGYLVRNGPVTGEDRWEEDGGYSPFTLATEIAALLAAADFADCAGERGSGRYMRQIADAWNDSIERWTYVTGTSLARESGVDGYYVRIAPPEVADAASPAGGFVPIKNRPPGESRLPTEAIVSPDALALVRYGLRAADDPRILETVRVIDHALRTETVTGPVWHRYPDDGYGEHADGRPFDGTGIGRGWPLLAGERGHYELARGDQREARQLLDVMAAQSGRGGLMSEQVWDAPAIPERELVNGAPSGSAMPLVWAHSEFVQLSRSLNDGRVFATPPQPVERYQRQGVRSALTLWRFGHMCRSMPVGRQLRVEANDPGTLVWTIDGWQSTHEAPLTPSGLGTYFVDLPTAELEPGRSATFTFRWDGTGRWQGRNYDVSVEPPAD